MSLVGYSEEDIERFRKVFRTLPSYKETISTKDYPAYLQAINFIKPQEAYQRYIEYGDRTMGGKFEISDIMKYIRIQHDPCRLLTEMLGDFDPNNDGYVSKEEFEFGLELLRVHDPRIQDVPYKNFVKEADTDKDGKISVAECKNWLQKNFAV